jgi:hypothetical protein
MRYVYYFIWAVVFYIIQIALRPQCSHFDIRLIIVALLCPLVFKKWLPLLKNTRFPEISARWNKIVESITNATTKTKECSVCGAKANFKLVLGYNTDKALNPRKTKPFCRAHGLETWKKELQEFKGILVIAEPDIDQVSGSFFYEPDDLKTHAYKKEDRETLEKMIRDFSKRKQKDDVLWLPKDVIGICQDPPLFKQEKDFELITINEAISRINRILQQIENRYSKGEFWITEPRGEGGIYIWDGEV